MGTIDAKNKVIRYIERLKYIIYDIENQKRVFWVLPINNTAQYFRLYEYKKTWIIINW